LKKTPPIPRIRPRGSVLAGGFDFSDCGDCTSFPPFEPAEMSNSEPSAIVLQGITCMCGLYKFQLDGENGALKIRRADSNRSGDIFLIYGFALIRMSGLVADQQYAIADHQSGTSLCIQPYRDNSGLKAPLFN
jgi:hypothetical protein